MDFFPSSPRNMRNGTMHYLKIYIFILKCLLVDLPRNSVSVITIFIFSSTVVHRQNVPEGLTILDPCWSLPMASHDDLKSGSTLAFPFGVKKHFPILWGTGVLVSPGGLMYTLNFPLRVSLLSFVQNSC
jgi:hypothetical protein